MTTPVAHFNSRVQGRTTLAQTLRDPKYSDILAQVGLCEPDLAEIQKQGELAAQYDRKQHDDLGTQRQTVAQAAQEKAEFEAELEHLRNRVPAVVADLRTSDATMAGWLTSVAFDKMRVIVRDTEPQPGTPDPAAPAKPVKEMVERRDRYSRALSAAQLTAALLEPERAVVVRTLAQRGFPEKRLKAFHAVAQDLAERLGGKETLKTSEFTRLEADAVLAQKARWDACRRMIRQAVQGDATLERLWAAC